MGFALTTTPQTATVKFLADHGTLDALDQLAERIGSANRSEAIRTAISDQMARVMVSDPRHPVPAYETRRSPEAVAELFLRWCAAKRGEVPFHAVLNAANKCIGWLPGESVLVTIKCPADFSIVGGAGDDDPA